ncbi:hypothetical protein [Vibrio cyclitrophicus]|uniref:Uncharacterized protein n=1 Tax=Vibrio cyclitrophicus ZF270 TaxID=1136176 RepID=A0AAN0N835_9VIBR|nr:hypothetical protein [Vibrio cyclitrophicus]PMH74493.1 hypothetical protein BCU59_19775 [Vibrio cyclitrophicus]
MNYINSENKNGLWELEIKGIEGPILASDYLGLYGSTPDEARTASIKRKIVVHSAEGGDFIQCGYCGLPVRYRARSATGRAAFYHKHTPELEEVDCPFHSDYKGEFAFYEAEMHETKWHFRTKHFIAGTLKGSEKIKCESIQVEKYIFAEKGDPNRRRKPDIYFEDLSGNRFAIELIQGWLDPEIIHAREQFFLREEVNLIWLFSEGRSDSIFYYIMYGSALEAHPESFAEFESKVRNIQCNAFVFSQEALDKSQESGEFYFEAHFPEFDFKSTELFLEMSYGCQMVVLSDLMLSPERLPYAINTKAALHGKQQELSAAIKEKAQRESQQALERIKKTIKQICEDGDQGTLSGPVLSNLSDEIAECFDYVLSDNSERNPLFELANQAIARAGHRIEEEKKKIARSVHARELWALRIQFAYARRELNQSITIQELTKLKHNLIYVATDYKKVISSELSSRVWDRYLNTLLVKIGQQTDQLAEGLPKPRALWSITNDLLSYSLDKRMQLFETRSTLAVDMSQQKSAYLIHKSDTEIRVFEEKLNEIKYRTKTQYMNNHWKALMGNWSADFVYEPMINRAGQLLCIDAYSELVGHEQDWVEEALNKFVERLVVLINEFYDKAFIKNGARIDKNVLDKLLTFWNWLDTSLYIYNQPEAIDRAYQLRKYLQKNNISIIE